MLLLEQIAYLVLRGWSELNLDSLHEKINHKIEELQELSVMVDRLTDPRMVTLSQELDQLILEYQHFLISKKSPSS
ncbi:hypothetical protein CGZ90_13230 [Fictibacillus aquaticus]|uniref:Aspartyl-phosphate phosphatase Spo0E family protein n=1 Tax=Fictibacillus aquaticus TaxID=2021314 RepID=A0A235F9C8_9BACL|nr:hypothetical protein CGZ90_13230 [Fictibacillus aquaticus]